MILTTKRGLMAPFSVQLGVRCLVVPGDHRNHYVNHFSPLYPVAIVLFNGCPFKPKMAASG